MRRTHSALGMPVAADTFWSSTWNVYGLCLCVEFAFFVITLEEYLRERAQRPEGFRWVLLGTSVVMFLFHAAKLVWLAMLLEFQEMSKISQTCQKCKDSLDELTAPTQRSSPLVFQSASSGVDQRPLSQQSQPHSANSTSGSDKRPLSPQSQPEPNVAKSTSAPLSPQSQPHSVKSASGSDRRSLSPQSQPEPNGAKSTSAPLSPQSQPHSVKSASGSDRR